MSGKRATRINYQILNSTGEITPHQSSTQLSTQSSTQPSTQFSTQPSTQSSTQLSTQSSTQSSTQPSNQSSPQPSNQLSIQSSIQLSDSQLNQFADHQYHPAVQLSTQFTDHPSIYPVNHNSTKLADQQSSHPADQPSIQLADHPSILPADHHSTQLADHRSILPADQHSTQLADHPSIVPADHHSIQLADHPSIIPADKQSSEMSSGYADIIILIEELQDIIDENPIDGTPVAELDATVTKLEEKRILLRKQSFDLLREDDQDKKLSVSISTTLASIKNYIKASKEYKYQLHQVEVKHSMDADKRIERSLVFSVEDLQRHIFEVETSLSVNLTNASDSQLIDLKKSVPTITSKIDKIAEKYENLLQSPIRKAELLMDIKDIGEKYIKLTKMNSSYLKLLKKQIEEREVYKQQTFDESKLNIHLDKFLGYDSKSDIYTFQTDFNKLYTRNTPRKMLPDLLKNNLLADPALSLVKSLTDIDEIWHRLKAAYGDTKLLLSKKLQQLIRTDQLTRTKDPEMLVQILNDVINTLKELMKLAQEHGIEENLFYGDGLDRFYNILGNSRLTRWLSSIADEQLSPKTTWLRLIQFLEKEQKLQQQKMLISSNNGYANIRSKSSKLSDASKTDTSKNDVCKNNRSQRYGQKSYISYTSADPVCAICDSPDATNDHVSTSGPGGSRIIQYYSCKKFAELSPANRLSLLKSKGLCFQCLFPAADASSGRHKEGKCQHDFTCQHESHQRYPVRKHVLVCEEHKDSQANKDLLERFKQRFITRSTSLPSFARNISLSFHSTFSYVSQTTINGDGDSINDKGLFLLQTVNINRNNFTIFYDNGCSDFIVKQSAITLLGKNATKISNVPIQIGGVGDTTTESTLGTFNVKLPMFNGQHASLTGTCLKSITTEFPRYPLSEVMDDIQRSFASNINNAIQLPQPSSSIGGEVHLMIGVKYLRYHPRLVHQLTSGLGIYESVFQNADGGRGIIGGPHPIFTRIHQSFFNQSEALGFFTNQYKLFQMGVQINPDVKMLSFPSKQKRFEASEMTGSEISYRCIQCRSCKTCKDSDHQQDISIKEEVEQEIINASLKIELQSNTITAILPFIHNPTVKLAPNKQVALKVYNQQLNKLNKSGNEKDKADIIASEKKLQDLGFVEFVNDLPTQQQEMLRNSSIQNFIPWRAVWKPSSISTPCRIVFDASQPTPSGYSLNDILAKGTNNLNKLQEILIRWSLHKIGIHTDISKMYNTVRLDPCHWHFQRYIWENELDPSKIPKEKIIKTLIYGIRSSGNQAELGLRKIADLHKYDYPEVNKIIQNDVYVDDCITGESDIIEAYKISDELEVITSKGGFKLKGITISGEDPPSHLTDDGESIGVGGLKWYSKTDEISLCISELNFSQKRRGKKAESAVNVIPEVLTRRHCASKVAEIFDITGKIAPLVASMKLDLRELSDRKLNWDDTIPDELRPIWISHFEMMQEIGQLRFKRVVVPEDAVSLDVETIDFGDASQSLICVCIYARFQRKNGEYSCQLVFSRTRTVPKELSLPRAELYASLMNAHTGEVIRRSFKSYFRSATKFTDSQITLYWITNEQKTLKQWVRNRVIEINRFTTKQQWFYIRSKDMVADIGTRRGATLEDVNQDSAWINGLPWMKTKFCDFPKKSSEDIKLNENEVSEINKESQICREAEVNVNQVNEEVIKRYKFSRYLLDPNQHSFTKVVRILAYVKRFCECLQRRIKMRNGSIEFNEEIKNRSIYLTKEELSSAENYYFKKGSSEVKQFLQSSKYENITKDVDGILIYTGRILPDQNVSIVGRFTNTMKDLSTTTFCVPVLEKHSPISYSVIMDTHWNDPIAKHTGIETTCRFVMKKVYVIEGRQLVKQIRNSCERCRYLMKRTVDMAMAPVSIYNLTIAPAFFFTQLDLSGPYLAYSPQHKRTTIKVWLIVFCCCSTSAVSIKVMDDYSTTSFILAFTRFSCDHGFPKRLLCDEGSQLVKGCKEMRLDFRNIKSQLMKNQQIEFEVCPVQGHYMHGKVERKIKEINQSIEKSAHNHRLSILQWESLSAVIANGINNLPLALGDITGDFECMDLITPNRLLLGRNNERSPDGIMVHCENPTKIMKENEKIYDSWFEIWLLVHVPKLMRQQKWFESDIVHVGDVVIFTKVDSVISKNYTYGMIIDLENGKDGLPRKAKIRYRNSNEEAFRETFRAVRGLVIIHRANESDIMTELGRMAKDVDFSRK